MKQSSTFLAFALAAVAVPALSAHADRNVAVPEPLAPLRAKLETKKPKLAVTCWVAPLPDLGYENPCHLAGDFDGDGRQDLALLVQERSGKQRRGVAVILAKGEIRIAGAGTRTGNGGADFAWMNAWKIEPKGDNHPRADGLVVEETESASGLLLVKGSRITWRQHAD